MFLLIDGLHLGGTTVSLPHSSQDQLSGGKFMAVGNLIFDYLRPLSVSGTRD